jgi:hypothetical protein
MGLSCRYRLSTAVLPIWDPPKLANQLRLDLSDIGFVYVRDGCCLKIAPDGVLDQANDISPLACSQGFEFFFHSTW